MPVFFLEQQRMTPVQTTVLIIDLLSVAVLCFGLVLHHRLCIDRHAFLSVLHVGGSLKKPPRISFLGWAYVFVTLLMILLSVAPFLAPNFF